MRQLDYKYLYFFTLVTKRKKLQNKHRNFHDLNRNFLFFLHRVGTVGVLVDRKNVRNGANKKEKEKRNVWVLIRGVQVQPRHFCKCVRGWKRVLATVLVYAKTQPHTSPTIYAQTAGWLEAHFSHSWLADLVSALKKELFKKEKLDK